MLETGQPHRPTPFPVQPRVSSDALEEFLRQSDARTQAAIARAHRQLTVLVTILATLVLIALLS